MVAVCTAFFSKFMFKGFLPFLFIETLRRTKANRIPRQRIFIPIVKNPVFDIKIRFCKSFFPQRKIFAQIVIPCIKTDALFVSIQDNFARIKITTAQKTFKNSRTVIVPSHFKFSTWKAFEYIFNFCFCDFRLYLFHTFIRSMRFGNKNSDIYIALNFCFCLKLKKKIDYSFFFTSLGS